jgi:magnesium-transporting ATPase (P-type)
MNGQVAALSDELRAQVLAQNDAMAREALRVLAVCGRDLPSDLTEYILADRQNSNLFPGCNSPTCATVYVW